MSRGVQDIQGEISNIDHLPIIYPYANKGRRAIPVHDHWNIQCSGHFYRSREVICMRMSVQYIVNTYPFLCGYSAIALQLAILVRVARSRRELEQPTLS